MFAVFLIVEMKSMWAGWLNLHVMRSHLHCPNAQRHETVQDCCSPCVRKEISVPQHAEPWYWPLQHRPSWLQLGLQRKRGFLSHNQHPTPPRGKTRRNAPAATITVVIPFKYCANNTPTSECNMFSLRISLYLASYSFNSVPAEKK